MVLFCFVFFYNELSEGQRVILLQAPEEYASSCGSELKSTIQKKSGLISGRFQGSKTFGSIADADIQVRRPDLGLASRRVRSLLCSNGNWQGSLIGVRVLREWDSDIKFATVILQNLQSIEIVLFLLQNEFWTSHVLPLHYFYICVLIFVFFLFPARFPVFVGGSILGGYKRSNPWWIIFRMSSTLELLIWRSFFW